MPEPAADQIVGDHRSAPTPGAQREAREARVRAVDFVQSVAVVQNITPGNVAVAAEPIARYLATGELEAGMFVPHDRIAEFDDLDAKAMKAHDLLTSFLDEVNGRGEEPPAEVVEARVLLADALGVTK